LLICYNKLINIKEREFGYDSGDDTIIAAGFNAGGDFHNAVAGFFRPAGGGFCRPGVSRDKNWELR